MLGRIVCQLINEAAFALGEGVGSAADIDAGMVHGLNYPRGPLGWADPIGLDHVLEVLDGLVIERHEERYRAAPELRRLVLVGPARAPDRRGLLLLRPAGHDLSGSGAPEETLREESMRAVTFQAPREVRVEDRPAPELEDRADAIVSIDASGICGSDLHIYHGRVKIEPGFTIGHEFVGTVVAAGDGRHPRQARRPGPRLLTTAPAAPVSSACAAPTTSATG